MIVVSRLIARLATVAVAALVLAPVAHADTMVYVKNGYVYIANANGSSARAVTPQSKWWAWPSEADNGVIAVAGGAARVVNGTFNPSGSDQIFEFNQQGKQVSGPVNTEGSFSTVSDPEYVTHFRVAPDNSYVAWTVLPSYADASTSWEKPTGENAFHWTKDSDGGLLPYSSPEWWGTKHLLITHDGVTLFNEAQYAMYSIADGSAPGWNQDEAIGDSPSYQVVVDRSGLKYAVLTDDAADNLGTVKHAVIHFETTSTPPSNPSSILPTGCTITLPASEYATPSATQLASMSFSSDSGTLAWAQDDGIYEANVSDPRNCQQITGSVHRVVPGGAMPFLSPAGLSAAPRPSAAPNTRITAFALNARKRSATVHFSGSGSGKLSFQCKVNSGAWRSCRSPITLKQLSRGRHRFEVRARNSAGRVDPTPAVKTFRVR
jgi:hypothetical protein